MMFTDTLLVTGNTDKPKTVERRRRKVTGLRFLREATDDSPKGPKIAGLECIGDLK